MLLSRPKVGSENAGARKYKYYPKKNVNVFLVFLICTTYTTSECSEVGRAESVKFFEGPY